MSIGTKNFRGSDYAEKKYDSYQISYPFSTIPNDLQAISTTSSYHNVCVATSSVRSFDVLSVMLDNASNSEASNFRKVAGRSASGEKSNVSSMSSICDVSSANWPLS
ncbi:hypothetical protein DPMN_156208 [Dreissena polymorpha]|uniref:Uncharacterized protein n=1 Tax=Dreissena polymorpha TaxID=45954 RepID=A0A9D4FTZ1_DREPO|nr:hypothetical protein DPMN_156208 [Dreissena polymorpha]